MVAVDAVPARAVSGRSPVARVRLHGVFRTGMAGDGLFRMIVLHVVVMRVRSARRLALGHDS